MPWNRPFYEDEVKVSGIIVIACACFLNQSRGTSPLHACYGINHATCSLMLVINCVIFVRNVRLRLNPQFKMQPDVLPSPEEKDARKNPMSKFPVCRLSPGSLNEKIKQLKRSARYGLMKSGI